MTDLPALKALGVVDVRQANWNAGTLRITLTSTNARKRKERHLECRPLPGFRVRGDKQRCSVGWKSVKYL